MQIFCKTGANVEIRQETPGKQDTAETNQMITKESKTKYKTQETNDNQNKTGNE